MAAILLGTGDGDLTLTVPVDIAVPADGVLQLVNALYWLGNPDAPNGNTVSCDDSQSLGPWDFPNLVTTPPVIGQGSSNTGVSPFPVLMKRSAARACLAGDLQPGDSATIVFDSSPSAQSVSPNAPAAAGFKSVGLLLWIPAAYSAIAQGGSIVYNNGDGQPGVPGIGTFHSLDWTTDPVSDTAPDANAILVTAMAASPGQAGFLPYIAGSLVGEKTITEVSIACGVSSVAAGTSPNPGGTWPSDRDLLDGNYQYLERAPGQGLYAWKRL